VEQQGWQGWQGELGDEGGADHHAEAEGMDYGSGNEPWAGAGGAAPAVAARRRELLSDGSPAQHICFWAVELQLHHPMTGEALHMRLRMPPALADVMEAEAAWASASQL
jgi:hypothetical protein